MGRLAAVLLVACLLPVSIATASVRTDGSTPAPPGIAQLVTSVPASTLDQVGAGEVSGPNSFPVIKLQGNQTSHGKPEVLSLNLAWCPHCLANSWSLAVALSRFGTLTGLRVLDSGTHFCKLAADPCTLGGMVPCYPHTHGLSFLRASFRSPYLSFTGIVLEDVRGHNLERPTPQENAAFNAFAPQGAAPALGIGGAYGFLGSGYSPAALTGKTWSQIAGSLARPGTQIARHVDGLANLFSAAICTVTNGRPAGVCKSRGVGAAGAAHLR